MLKMLDQLQQLLQLKMHAYRTINSAIENIPIPAKEKNIKEIYINIHKFTCIIFVYNK